MAQKEDNFIKLKQQIKNKETGNLYLFYGEETYIKELYLDRMKKEVPDGGFAEFNHIYLEGKASFGSDAEDALNSFPMMTDKKLIIIKNSGLFKSPTAEQKEFWQNRISDIPDFAMVIFDEQDIDKRSALFKSLSKHGLAVEFKYLKSYEISAWIMREVQKKGKKIDKSVAEYLVGMCDDGMKNVQNELDKLLNYCESEIYASDVDKVVSKPLNIVVFEITDAIMAGDADKAVSTAEKLRENKESAFNVLYLLFGAFEKMLRCKVLLDEGASYDAIASKLKLAPFIVRKYIDSSKGFSADFLTERVCRTAEIDMEIKQGETDEWTALLQYIFECLNSRR